MQLPYGGRAEIVRWLCDPRVFWGIRVPNVYGYSFLIEMALQTCKTMMQHKIDVRRPHGHGVVVVRLPHDDCSISVTFYGHSTGTMRQPRDSRAGAGDLSIASAYGHRAIFWFQNDHLKSCVLRAATLRCHYGDRAMLLRPVYGLQAYEFLICV